MTHHDPTLVQIVFDTHCVLCSRWVQFLLRHEADDWLRFVSAWSPTGLSLAARYGLGEQDLQRTYLVVRDGVGLTRSDAGLALLAHLKVPWRWLRLLRLVPRPIRDAAYDLVARNRYRWFGSTTICLMPTPHTRHRFTLD
jgi:predicted DCC family thiol-disulfide oxidoreductase YuxK